MRYTILDQDVRAKIAAEAARLHGRTTSNSSSSSSSSGRFDNVDKEEGVVVDIVQREIEAALERENLDRERGMAGEGAAHGDVKNSTVLLGDLEEVRQKVDRYRIRASLADLPEVKEAREAVASCYRYVTFLPYFREASLFSPFFFFFFFWFFPTERTRRPHSIAHQRFLHFAAQWRG